MLNPKKIVTDIIVVRSETFRVKDRAFVKFVQRNHVAAKQTGVVLNATSYYQTRDPKLVSRDGHATIIPLNVATHDEIELIIDLVERANADPRFAVSMTGEHTVKRDFDTLSQHDLKSGELRIGLPAALIVLLLVFGTIVAGLVPVLLAIVSIIVGLGVVALLSQQFELSIFILNLLTAMGSALGTSLGGSSGCRDCRSREEIAMQWTVTQPHPGAAFAPDAKVASPEAGASRGRAALVAAVTGLLGDVANMLTAAISDGGVMSPVAASLAARGE